jgi:thiamine transport system substrate-binding protein
MPIGKPVEPEPARTGGGKGTGFIHPYPLAALEDDMKHLAIAAGILTATSAVAADKPTLTVYTYDSFVSDWGPGPKVEEAFEAQCECDLNLVGVEDGAALLSRIRLEGENSDADIVLGLDTNLISAAKETGLFAPHSVTAEYALPIEWTDTVFAPYDWGYFAFVHNADFAAPNSFRELADSDIKIIIQDPRSSTPGLGLLLWVKAAYGDEAQEIWADLADNIVTVTKGWSESYGLFLEGEADMVLSYTTSPAYHLIAEEDASKAAAAFDEGHYMQVEVAAKLANSDQPELADQFLNFMVSDAFQTIIPTTNWMYPAVTPSSGLPEGFETLTIPQKSLLFDQDQAAIAREQALSEWLGALSQ